MEEKYFLVIDEYDKELVSLYYQNTVGIMKVYTCHVDFISTIFNSWVANQVFSGNYVYVDFDNRS